MPGQDYDYDVEFNHFNEQIAHKLAYPSDDLSFGVVRKMDPTCDFHFSDIPKEVADKANGRDFTSLLELEKCVAFAMMIKRKYGADAPEKVGEEETVAENLEYHKAQLRPLYEKAGLCEGEASFEQQIRRIESEINKHVQQKGG